MKSNDCSILRTNDISILHLGLSYKCNMRCSHCFSTKDVDLLNEYDYINIINQLCELGLFMVYYTYGEPLMADHFWNIVAYCRKKGLIQILMSNGMLIDNTIAKKIKSSGIDKVFISIDHYIPEKHDANRGVIGAFAKAISAIKNLQDNQVSVGVAVTVTQKNAEALWDIYRLCVDLNIKNISFLRERNKIGVADIFFDKLISYHSFFSTMVEQKTDGIMFHDFGLLSILDQLRSIGKIDEQQYEKYLIMNSCHKKNTICLEPNGCVSRCNLYKRSIGNYLENKTIFDMLEDDGEIWRSCYGQ